MKWRRSCRGTVGKELAESLSKESGVEALAAQGEEGREIDWRGIGGQERVVGMRGLG